MADHVRAAVQWDGGDCEADVMELYKYPWIRQIAYDDLEEFVKRVLGPMIEYIPPYRIAAVYHEMGTELIPMDGVSTEGAAWAAEGGT